MKTIYLTDQVQGHPDIRDISKEIMFSVTNFYKSSQKADGYRKTFTDQHKLAEDSGGFQFLMGKLPIEKCDPMKTVEIYKRIGVTRKDFPIQLDLPPRYALSKQERIALIIKGAVFYHQMTKEIDWTIPVVHGWTYEELSLSLSLIENPERLASGTFSGSAYDWVMGKLNSHEPRFKRKIVAAGSNIPLTKRPLAVGAWSIAQTATLRFTGGKTPRIVGVGSYKATAEGINLFDSKKAKAVAVGAMQQSGRFVLDEAGSNKKTVATPGCAAEEHVQKTPQIVVWERLALVLNMFRDRELFMLGAASPNDQHMIFLGGARYGDTSAWRLKAYLAEIYVPGRGSVCIGHKGSPKPTDEDLEILRECLRDTTHPLSGMSLTRFLTIGKMNMAEWRETQPKNKWEIKPFDLRAKHNAWVLKWREEVIANEYTADPDNYYIYLKYHRFKGKPNLLRKLEFLWRRFKRPYVQTGLELFLKGR